RGAASARFTAERSAKGKRGMTASAPSSAKATARTADASRTTLLTVFFRCLFPALPDQLIDHAFARTFVGGEGGLDPFEDLREGENVDTRGVCLHEHGIPHLDSRPLSGLCGKHHSPCLIDRCAVVKPLTVNTHNTYRLCKLKT